jgi:hypothetical protein
VEPRTVRRRLCPVSRQTAPYSPELEPDIVLIEPQLRHRTPSAWMIGSVNFGRPGPFFAGATPISIALACCRFDISVSICLIMSFVSMTPPNAIITKNKFSYGTVRQRIPLGGHTFVGHQYSKTKPQGYSPIFRSEQQTVRCGLPVIREEPAALRRASPECDSTRYFADYRFERAESAPGNSPSRKLTCYLRLFCIRPVRALGKSASAPSR